MISKVVEVVASGVRALESSGSAPRRVPGPSRTGRDPSESRRSISPTDLLPLAFADAAPSRAARAALPPPDKRALPVAQMPPRSKPTIMTAENFCEAHGGTFVQWLQDNTVECACAHKYGCSYG